MFRPSLRRAVLLGALLSSACVSTQRVSIGMEGSRELPSRSAQLSGTPDSVAYGQDADADPVSVAAMTGLVLMIAIFFVFVSEMGKVQKHFH